MTISARSALVTLTLAATSFGFGQRIHVQVDGNAVNFANAQPQYINGRVLVPLRGVFEQMGATVHWNRESRMVSAHRGSADVELRIGDPVATVNGSEVHLDVPATIVGGSTMVPIRFVSEALGAQVGWLEADQLVTITTAAAEATTVTAPHQRLRNAILRANDVIRVRLSQTLSSSGNHSGDTFMAAIRTDGSENNGGLPNGTVVEGHVVATHRMNGNRPASLTLVFDHLRFPDGKRVRIDGTVNSIDGDAATLNGNGTLVAREGDQRLKLQSGTDMEIRISRDVTSGR